MADRYLHDILEIDLSGIPDQDIGRYASDWLLSGLHSNTR